MWLQQITKWTKDVRVFLKRIIGINFGLAVADLANLHFTIIFLLHQFKLQYPLSELPTVGVCLGNLRT